MITIETTTVGISFTATDTNRVHTAYFENTTDQHRFITETLPEVGTLTGYVVRVDSGWSYTFTYRGRNHTRHCGTPDAVATMAEEIAKLSR